MRDARHYIVTIIRNDVFHEMKDVVDNDLLQDVWYKFRSVDTLVGTLINDIDVEVHEYIDNYILYNAPVLAASSKG